MRGHCKKKDKGRKRLNPDIIVSFFIWCARIDDSWFIALVGWWRAILTVKILQLRIGREN